MRRIVFVLLAVGALGFAQFDEGKPVGEAMRNTCVPWHAIAKARDFVFNRYVP